MPPEESLYPGDWMRVAAKDLKRAYNLFKDEDLEGAGFHLQQAVEKRLKAFLLHQGWKLRRIHDLEVLLNAAVKYDPSLERFRGTCLKATQYYFEERYPFTVHSELTEEEIIVSLQAADDILDLVQKKLTDTGDEAP